MQRPHASTKTEPQEQLISAEKGLIRIGFAANGLQRIGPLLLLFAGAGRVMAQQGPARSTPPPRANLVSLRSGGGINMHPLGLKVSAPLTIRRNGLMKR